MQLPTRLNGHKVLQTQACQDDVYVVMCYREGHVQPYVVATWKSHMGSEWHQGNYCQNRPEADKVFSMVCKLRGSL